LLNAFRLENPLTFQTDYFDISPCGDFIVNCLQRNQLTIMDFKSFEVLFQLPIKKNILSVKFTKDGGKFILGDDKSEVTIWDFEEIVIEESFLIDSQ